MKRTSKIIMVLAVLLVSTTLVSAALLTYFGQVQTTANVEQAVVIGDNTGWHNWNEPITYTIPEPAPGGETFCKEQWIWNRASIPVSVSFATNGYEGITTTYSKQVETTYTLNYNVGDVGVTVEDMGNSLKWTYTDSTQMSVAINFPAGFVIHTSDGHYPAGWYYSIDGGAQGGALPAWVTVTGNEGGGVMTVSILKSALGDSFKWHGYAVHDLVGVWIGIGPDNGGSWLPKFDVTLKSWQPLTSPFTLLSQQKLLFRICYAFDLHIGPGTYTLYTTVDANKIV